MGHHDVEDSNPTNNETLGEVTESRFSRRALLRGSASVAAVGTLASLGLAGCSDDDDPVAGNPDQPGKNPTEPPNNTVSSLTFEPVGYSKADRVVLPAGYSAAVLYATGDAIYPGVSEYRNDGTNTDFDKRAGDQHDGMNIFGLSDSGTYDPERSDRMILWMNHEQIVADPLHENGATAAADNGGARPKVQVDREMNAHGVSVIEIQRRNGDWSVNKNSIFNRRLTAFTEMELQGPVAGHELTKTKASPDGTRRFGTLNNCATGKTPWGTAVTCEENWYAYFVRGDDQSARSASENDLLSRYGIRNDSGGWSYREWDTVEGGGDLYKRFDITASGATQLDDFRNEPNLFGYVVEADPFRPGQAPRARTALGRFSHETASFAPAQAGKPIVVYSGDDARGEYIYKFVSDENWDPADEGQGLAAGDKYLNKGTLYAARFKEDGTGEWLPLTPQNVQANGGDAQLFGTTADVLLRTRLAADAVGATRMDRPEWGTIHPKTGEVYFTLTNNEINDQGLENVTQVDPANPRFYRDPGSPDKDEGNPNGHIIRWKEQGSRAGTTFEWDIFLFGSDESQDTDNINLSELSVDSEFSAPDGMLIDPRGIAWIQTDDSALSEKTNDQMLAAIPGQVGDGAKREVTSTQDGFQPQTVTTYVGKSADEVQLKRFLVGPEGCEITGVVLTPDARSLFINIQHPSGKWPSPSGDATAIGNANRPRSATIVITRDDGGEIAV
ncbi:hypothetical protein C8D92_10461 [Tamilnaduibacter salinus]|uniref:dTDP-glucose 4,6-dehydratase n=1 Tax=Tamilnaduibacter salinus TaxID=1484056 RepID=A0A2U1CX58_9GAMM|nr:PhoX family phosphatase [Tamilnaduibacter salinus]PVY76830.1 hypothetical protein C8D92_10461 [Tamilnaduibacter salinus]